LNGNSWQFGDSIRAGEVTIGGQTINFAYTFPNVTLPSDGTAVDMSYPAKVHGVCYGLHTGAWPPYAPSSFYGYYFLDGTYPYVSPAPCYITDTSPQCSLPWPALWSSVPRYGIQHDLVSQAVGFDAALARTLVKMIPGTESNCFTALGQVYCDYATTIWCTPATTPPLYQPSGVHDVAQAFPNPAYYWVTIGLCEKNPPGPWTCVGVTTGFLGFAAPDNYTKYSCTVPPN
jgi:hypothetical protein